MTTIRSFLRRYGHFNTSKHRNMFHNHMTIIYARYQFYNTGFFQFPSTNVRLKRSPECHVHPLFFAAEVAGQTVEPVLLGGALHQEQRSGKEWEPDEIWRAVLSPEFENPDGAERY